MSGLVVGLTGGIGSGKSTAADCFASLGAAVIDVDLIAHELTGPGGAAMPALRNAFGDSVIAADGRLDRPAMRHLAFSDPSKRRRLEAILHPLIRAESDRRCREALSAGAPYVVLVVPLLAESADYRTRVGRIAVVDCADALRVERVARRSGLSPDEIGRIMAAQASRAQRLAIADDLIDNGADPASLRRQVGVLHQRYLALSNLRSGSISNL